MRMRVPTSPVCSHRGHGEKEGWPQDRLPAWLHSRAWVRPGPPGTRTGPVLRLDPLLFPGSIAARQDVRQSGRAGARAPPWLQTQSPDVTRATDSPQRVSAAVRGWALTNGCSAGPARGTRAWELCRLSAGLGLAAPCGGSPLPPGATAETLAPRLLQQSQRFTGDTEANYRAGSAARHPSAEPRASARLAAPLGLPRPSGPVQKSVK